MNPHNTHAGALPTTGAYPVGTNTHVGDPAHPPSALKGNISAIVGKMTHNPTKEHDGNIMIANAAEQKAARFETKAVQWESKGNASKAQKNREKAARYRLKAATKMAQPLKSAQGSHPIGAVGSTAMSPALKSDKAARCEAKALEYERKGNLAKAQKNRERAWRIREKNSIPHPVGASHPSTYAGYTQHMTSVPNTAGMHTTTGTHPAGVVHTTGVHPTGVHTTGVHPTGVRQTGYTKMSRDQKAARFENKAQQWERQNNAAKAQKNREKAARYRGPRSAVGANPTLYNNKAARFEARALEYERKGNHAKAQRNRERAWKTREKHSIAHPAGSRHPNTYPNYNQQMSMLPVTGVYPTAGMHSTTGVHPTGVRQPGYTKMSREQKLARFENKAQQWERQNNAAKAQKNREKAARYRGPRSAAGVNRGDKAARFEARALEYERKGNHAKAQRNRERAWKTREKHSIAHPAGSRHPNTYPNYNQQMSILPTANVGFGVHPPGSTYQQSAPVFTTQAGTGFNTGYNTNRMSREQKAARFENKALLFERQGNALKAQKNREKAARYRGSKTAMTPALRGDKAARFEARALEYERKGNHAKAQRNRERAWRTREKHSIAHPAGSRHPNTYPNYNQQMSILRPTTGFPGAQQTSYPGIQQAGYPGTGYTKMTRAQKAARYENKALQWERQNNAAKAQKNRQKAVSYSTPRSAVGVNRGDKAARFEARALEYERRGNHAKAQRNRERAWRTREKHSIAHPAGSRHPNTYPNYNQQMSILRPTTGFTGAQQAGYPLAQQTGYPTTGGYPGAQQAGFPLAQQTGYPGTGYTKMTRAQKAARFENKALQWERQNNAAKAQRNRQKALGYNTPKSTGLNYGDKASRFEARALEYERKGNHAKAQRNRERAWRTREKHSVAHPAGSRHPNTYPNYNQQMSILRPIGFPGAQQAGYPTSGVYPAGTAYQTGTGYNTAQPLMNTRMSREQKAARFENKAILFERQGNALKAQKNREKAARYRGPKTAMTPALRGDRAARFEARALEYERRGNHAKAQRNRERAWKTREKHSIAHPAGSRHPNTYPNYNQQMSILNVGFGVHPPGSTYEQSAPVLTSVGTSYPTGTGFNTAQPLMNTNRMSREQKAARFENKALQWERQGNALKAQKNREKAQRYRGPKTTMTPALRGDRAARLEAKALDYERKGNLAKAQRSRERAWRIREKHSIAHPVGARHPSTYPGYQQQQGMPGTTNVQQRF